MAERKISIGKSGPVKASVFLGIVAVAVLVFPVGAFAESGEAEESESERRWELMVGAGVMGSPVYPGSDESAWTWFPAINASYQTGFVRWFIDFNELGAEASLGPLVPISFTFGAGLGDFQRDADDAANLAGTASVENRVRFFGQAVVSLPWSAGLGFRATYFPLTASYEDPARKDDEDSGMTFEAFLEREWMLFPLILNAGVGCTWMGGGYAETVYGVERDAAELSEFEAEAGLHDIHASVYIMMFLTEHIGLGSTIECSYLLGDAAKSPVAERAFQPAIGAFALYRF